MGKIKKEMQRERTAEMKTYRKKERCGICFHGRRSTSRKHWSTVEVGNTEKSFVNRGTELTKRTTER